ncbi:hypothetical protein [Sphingobacterium suaedae]|uniref:Type II toxin-antitoxin system RelE/ParE family toxin n=1 Tax=Sphingobacterium suaedae TaxID=1686402 RepID=A0ABW5KCA2_9SPHI
MIEAKKACPAPTAAWARLFVEHTYVGWTFISFRLRDAERLVLVTHVSLDPAFIIQSYLADLSKQNRGENS